LIPAQLNERGAFSVSNGKILGPGSVVWRGYGVCVFSQQVVSTSISVIPNYGSALANQILAMMPGINLIRVACTIYPADYLSPSSFSSFATVMTQAQVVVVFEHHITGSPVYSGAQLATESAWYASMAGYYLGNPYVWFASINEPGASDSLQMQATYNAIRGVGNNTIICMEAGQGSYGDGNTFGTNVFRSMRNIVWDLHAYNWMSSYSNVLATIIADQNSRMASIGAITSCDGVIPVICLETGNATDGTNVDAGGTQQIQAAFSNPNYVGAAAWVWNVNLGTSTIADNLTGIGGSTLNSYGLQVAGYVASHL
jgi:Cellulase (glycosyl hydrolase family 5)